MIAICMCMWRLTIVASIDGNGCCEYLAADLMPNTVRRTFIRVLLYGATLTLLRCAPAYTKTSKNPATSLARNPPVLYSPFASNEHH